MKGNRGQIPIISNVALTEIEIGKSVVSMSIEDDLFSVSGSSVRNDDCPCSCGRKNQPHHAVDLLSGQSPKQIRC